MESSFYTRRLTALALAGLMAMLAGLSFPDIVPQAAALAQDGIQPAEGETVPPRMVLTQMTYNAGQVERGEIITHRFTFRNSGGSDLVILSTKAG